MERSRDRPGTQILLSHFSRSQNFERRTAAMVKSPQHTVQIMETRARFDLKAALEDWRKQLEMQPGLTPDNRRELETHLRDSVTALQQRGLTEEESIILASRRVGQPQIL